MSSALFFRLEKRQASDRCVAALCEPDSTLVSSLSDLCASFVTFYSSLFSASCTDSSVQDSLFANISSFLSPNEASQCEVLLTFGECHRALLGMGRRKAPGSDGLPMEFYNLSWKVLGQDLVDVVNACYAFGSLSLSQRRGTISLFFKRDDRLDAPN